MLRTPPKGGKIQVVDWCDNAPQTNQLGSTVMLPPNYQPGPYLPQPQIINPNKKWETVRYGKRKGDSPEINNTRNVRKSKQSTLKNYWLNKPEATITTTNKFAPLEVVTNEEQKEIETPETTATPIVKIVKPPPIYVEGVQLIEPLIKALDETAKDGYIMKIMYNDQVRIQPNTEVHYTTILKVLTEKDTKFHTYQLKKHRTFRVVLRNIHQTTDTNRIKEAINALGHEVVNVSNIRDNKTKNGLPLFNIELVTKENNKEIYETTKLLNSIVKIEPPHPKRDIPQCTKCQRFGHTHKYCHHNPRCVKCTGNHGTEQCPRNERNNEVICVNCEEHHPANYKGCSVYKELQKRRFPPLRERQVSTVSTNNHIRQPGFSYAQMARANNRTLQDINNAQQIQYSAAPQQQSNNVLETMMTRMMEKMDKMMDLLTALITKMI